MRIGFISFAHMHATSYAACLQNRQDINIVGLFDELIAGRGEELPPVDRTQPGHRGDLTVLQSFGENQGVGDTARISPSSHYFRRTRIQKWG